MLQKTLTIDRIRSQYPNPMTVSESSSPTEDGQYCVGGAFMKAAGAVGLLELCFPFPTQGDLAGALAEVYGGDELEWRSVARKISMNNDRGDFEEAWSALREAIGQ